ncbi:peptidylglycine alpha-hydroxylating monooxygenase [Microplitis mediator]|uniref:peptidylglycine alpha-hydroxylating monooxygenase n=1 Tax=Microplitis mediator TaxID=375433 RepID=UPI0025559FD2|nr:peptidylglycine alpha-hydroxylating monooxygenase [Microplitis mediator]
MRKKYLNIIFYVTITFIIDDSQCNNDEIKKYPLLMPNVRPNVPELYLCTPVKINSSHTYYIVGYEPNATMEVAHHILIYGCKTPGTSKAVWNCGEMAAAPNNNVEFSNVASPCGEGSEILYAWARDAPTLRLPDGVGFKIGKDSQIKYLVLQVHYAHIDHFKDGVTTDDSGIILHYTSKPLHKLAGVYLLGTMGVIPAKSTEYMETACLFTENKVLHPFAYRTHTHSLGKVVAGYVIDRDNNWIELGKRDPLTPQMFYPIKNNVTITKGDILAARCTMSNYRDRDTYIGATNNDEMCNFYLMYYVDNDQTVDMKWCFTRGPPSFYWKTANLQNIPDREASML